MRYIILTYNVVEESLTYFQDRFRAEKQKRQCCIPQVRVWNRCRV